MPHAEDTSLFLDAEFYILVPQCPNALELPIDAPSSEVDEWLTDLHQRVDRNCCFYDENLLYLCRLTYRNAVHVDDETLSSFKRICAAVKITTQCSFIRRTAPTSARPGSSSHQSTVSITQDPNLGLPPVTPNPMPGTQAIHQQYAQAEGVQVWEGGLSGTAETSASPCLVVREDESTGGGCSAYWIGQVPLAFANVDMQDPLLALTCHATLRESKIGVASGRKKVEVGDQAPGEEGVEEVVTANDIMGMRDVLAGLGETSLPLRRLQKPGDQVSEDPSSRSTPSSLARPEPAMVLRKSYRSILPLYSAITVKMRTLPTPLSQATDTDDGESLTSTICIEIEAGHVQPELSFQVTDVRVTTRQTEGAYTTTDIIHVWTADDGQDSDYFPFRLERYSQHNLVYNIKADASSATSGQTQNQYLSAHSKVEHLRIDVDGFAATVDGQNLTPVFTSTWNTVLELRDSDLQSRVAYLKPINSDPSAKSPARPLSMPPTSARSRHSGQYPSKKPPPKALHRDLVVSLNLIETNERGALSPKDESDMNQINLFDTIDAEVTILNVSGRTVRLVLSDLEDGIAGGPHPSSVRPQELSKRTSVTSENRNPIIMLQNDLKLAPLLPRSCQSVRLRFMAMMHGTQRIPGFRLTDFERDQQADLNFEMYLQIT